MNNINKTKSISNKKTTNKSIASKTTGKTRNPNKTKKGFLDIYGRKSRRNKKDLY
jgi:hypothetical protein